MFYIFEGPDAAGKTTLAQQFTEQVWHNGPDRDLTREQLFVKYESQMYLASALPDYRVVIDRSYMSEFVYGTILRQRGRLTLHDLNYFEGLAAELGAIRVYLTAVPAVLDARLAHRDEQDDLDDIERAYTRSIYESLTGSEWVRIDTSSWENDEDS